jgi:hypothetical protein
MWLRVIVGFRFTIIIIAAPSYAFIERHFSRMKAAKKCCRSNQIAIRRRCRLSGTRRNKARGKIDIASGGSGRED